MNLAPIENERIRHLWAIMRQDPAERRKPQAGAVFGGQAIEPQAAAALAFRASDLEHTDPPLLELPKRDGAGRHGPYSK